QGDDRQPVRTAGGGDRGGAAGAGRGDAGGGGGALPDRALVATRARRRRARHGAQAWLGATAWQEADARARPLPGAGLPAALARRLEAVSDPPVRALDAGRGAVRGGASEAELLAAMD